MGKILLYYKYIDIENPEEQMLWQRQLCQSLGLKGRIIIAHEGINGTLGGSNQAIDQYKENMNKHSLFSEIDFKESSGEADHFPRLQIKVKKEIVNLGVDTRLVSAKNNGKYLEPEQAHELISQKCTNLVLLDTRNNYESRVGTFENAIIPNTQTFREFPDYIDKNIDLFKDKEVIMFCTGGVRCERASAYLKLKNITKEVYHIKGGIHKYVEKFPNGYFKGKNYVFDRRVTVQVSEDILSNCELCQIAYDEYTNCINAECNKQIIVCPNCIGQYHNTCSPECLALIKTGYVNVRTIPHKLDITKQ